MNVHAAFVYLFCCLLLARSQVGSAIVTVPGAHVGKGEGFSFKLRAASCACWCLTGPEEVVSSCLRLLIGTGTFRIPALQLAGFLPAGWVTAGAF